MEFTQPIKFKVSDVDLAKLPVFMPLETHDIIIENALRCLELIKNAVSSTN